MDANFFTTNVYGMGEYLYGILSERLLIKDNNWKQNACNERFEQITPNHPPNGGGNA